MALPNLLASVLAPDPSLTPATPVLPPGFSDNLARKRALAAAERENWPDFLRGQYGLPSRRVRIPERPDVTPINPGIENQFPLLNALLTGGDLGAGLRNVGNGGAMGRLAPSFTAPAVAAAPTSTAALTAPATPLPRIL